MYRRRGAEPALRCLVHRIALNQNLKGTTRAREELQKLRQAARTTASAPALSTRVVLPVREQAGSSLGSDQRNTGSRPDLGCRSMAAT